VVAGKFAWTPGGLALSFGRMLQDGIVQRYLADHCTEKHFKLCSFRHQLPDDADAFFWGGDSTAFNKLGRFKGLGDEMSTIVLGSLRDYPGLQIKMALAATVHQLVRVSTGEGVLNTIWHTYWAIEKFEPTTAKNMRAARQQRGEITFTAINALHRPVALGSMALLLATVLLGWRRQRFADLGLLAGTTAAALLANAFVCGVLSNPHDRYGARLVWIAPFVIALLLCRLYAEYDRQRTGAITAPLAANPGPTG
jgi:hypothetical protein